MKFCTNCGTRLVAGLRFCTSCGTPLSAAPVEPPPLDPPPAAVDPPRVDPPGVDPRPVATAPSRAATTDEQVLPWLATASAWGSCEVATLTPVKTTSTPFAIVDSVQTSRKRIPTAPMASPKNAADVDDAAKQSSRSRIAAHFVGLRDVERSRAHATKSDGISHDQKCDQTNASRTKHGH